MKFTKITSMLKSNFKNSQTFQPESIIDISNQSREERMEYLLEKMDSFLRKNKIIRDTKLNRREQTRIGWIEKYNPDIKVSHFDHDQKGFLYSPIRCFENSDERKKHLYGSIAEQKLKIPSGTEYNILISFIDNDLKRSDVVLDSKLENVLSENSLLNNAVIVIEEDINTLQFEEEIEEDKNKVCIYNIKNNFFDIELKLKVELKKLEYLEQAENKRRINMDEVTGNDKNFLSNFSKLNFSSQKRENPFIESFQIIKEFYVDSKNVGVTKPKRYSIIDELKKENFFEKNKELNIDEKKSDKSESEFVENENKKEKSKPKQKRQSMIVSCLFKSKD